MISSNLPRHGRISSSGLPSVLALARHAKRPDSGSEGGPRPSGFGRERESHHTTPPDADLSPALWRAPPIWDLDILRARLSFEEEPLNPQVLAQARSLVSKLQEGHMCDSRLDVVQRHLTRLLKSRHLSVDMEEEAARALASKWTRVKTGDHAVLVAYSALCQWDLLYLRHASAEGDHTQESAHDIVQQLFRHVLSVLILMKLADCHNSDNDERGLWELCTAQAAGAVVEAASAAMKSFAEGSVQFQGEEHDQLRVGTGLLVRYLVRVSTLDGQEECQGPLASWEPTTYMTRPLSEEERGFLDSIPTLMQPPSTEAVEWLGRIISSAAIVPLVAYAECQHSLALGTAAAKADVEIAGFVNALLFHVGHRCLIRSDADNVPLDEAKLGFRAMAQLWKLRTLVAAAAPGQPGTPQASSPSEQAAVKERDHLALDPHLITRVRKYLLGAYPLAVMLSQEEWQEQIGSLMEGVTELLAAGNIAGADALTEEHLNLFQEPLLVTINSRPPTWEELGGNRLAEEAARVGAAQVLLKIRAELGQGPYMRDERSLELLLQACLRGRELQALVAVVEDEAVRASRLKLPLNPGTWTTLGHACASVILVGEEQEGLVPRLLHAIHSIAEGRAAELEVSAPLLATSQQAAADVLAARLSALPALFQSLLAVPGWPDVALLAVFQTMLSAGLIREAVEQLGGLARGTSALGRDQKPAEEGTVGLEEMLAAALIQTDQDGLERLSQALRESSSPAAGMAACLVSGMLLQRAGAEAAWYLLKNCLPAATTADPTAVGSVIREMYTQGLYEEIVTAHAALSGAVHTTQAARSLACQLEDFTALSQAHLGRVNLALDNVAGLSCRAVAAIVAILEDTGQPLSSKDAKRLIDACMAHGHSSLVIQLYDRLKIDGPGGRGQFSPAMYDAVLQAYLNEVQASGSRPPAAPSQADALMGALDVLRSHHDALLTQNNAALAKAVGAAAVCALAGLGPQRLAGDILDCYLAVERAQGLAGPREELRLQYRLLPAVQLHLWGLSLLSAYGVDPSLKQAEKAKKAEPLRAQLSEAVRSIAAHARSGQLLLFLELLPSWTSGMDPKLPNYEALLCCAREDGVLGSEAGHSVDDAVANRLAAACQHLTSYVQGGGGGARLSTPAMVGVLLVGRAKGDVQLMDKAFQALQNRDDLLKGDAGALNWSYSALLGLLFSAYTRADKEGGSSKQGEGTLQLCTRVLDVWQPQLAALGAEVLPATAEAYEAVAAVRMIGQLKYSAGWKLLQDMEGRWARLPSKQTLIVVLQRAAQQVQEAEPFEQKMELVKVWSQVAHDLAAAREPTKWPPLDDDLAAEVVQLLLACHRAARSEKQLAPGTKGSWIGLAQGVKAVLLHMCREQQPIGQRLCERACGTFNEDPELEEWAMEAFGEAVVKMIYYLAIGELEGELLLYLQQEQQQEEEGEEEEDSTGEGVGPSGAAVQVGATGIEILKGVPDAVAKDWKARMEGAKRIKTWEDLEKHMKKHGWKLQRDKRHNVYVLFEEGLPRKQYIFGSTPSDGSAARWAKRTLLKIYRRSYQELEMWYQSQHP